MKRLLFVLAPVLMICLFTQCQNDDAVTPDEMLIAEIENATNKVNIEPDALPAAAQATIDDEYFDSYIETCAQVAGKGYEVILGNEDQLYFRENGLRLRGGPDGTHRPGPCGRGLLVPVTELPDAITAYVAENYPDAEILRAKKFPRGFVLLITGRRLLIFDNDLDFILETMAHFCDQMGHPVDVSNLPEAITTYVTDNYPDGEIVRAFQVRGGRIVLGLSTPDGRVILVFDAEGNFLFARG